LFAPIPCTIAAAICIHQPQTKSQRGEFRILLPLLLIRSTQHGPSLSFPLLVPHPSWLWKFLQMVPKLGVAMSPTPICALLPQLKPTYTREFRPSSEFLSSKLPHIPSSPSPPINKEIGLNTSIFSGPAGL
jgi:hypothetical protein